MIIKLEFFAILCNLSFLELCVHFFLIAKTARFLQQHTERLLDTNQN